MRKSVLLGILAIIIIGGGGFLALHKSSPKTADSTGGATTQTAAKPAAPAPSSATADQTTAAGPAGPMNVTVSANDDSASPETITAKAGQTVNIKFAVSKVGTYHGGLDFKSTDPAIDSGSIDEGDTKTVTFTASKPFKFTPFWYKSDVQKDYFVTVNVT